MRARALANSRLPFNAARRRFHRARPNCARSRGTRWHGHRRPGWRNALCVSGWLSEAHAFAKQGGFRHLKIDAAFSAFGKDFLREISVFAFGTQLGHKIVQIGRGPGQVRSCEFTSYASITSRPVSRGRSFHILTCPPSSAKDPVASALIGGTR